MKIKTSELIGAQLDWVVAKAVGVKVKIIYGPIDGRPCPYDENYDGFSPSTDWSQGGPLIESCMVVCDYGRPLAASEKPLWFAQVWKPYGGMTGNTPLVAAMRAIVAAKLGEEIEVPEELV